MEIARSEIHDRRVTALDTPTERIRQNLTRHYRAVRETEAAAFRLF